MFPKTDVQSGWGAHGTEGGPLASFFKRYYRPLTRYACFKFSLSEDSAEELTSRFLAEELEREGRERSIYRLYEPEKGRFRSLLATSFWRFCRDELEKQSRRRRVSLEHPESVVRENEARELGRLIAREMFDAVRVEIASGLSLDERGVLDLKWPRDPDGEPATNAEVERELGLTRGRVRAVMKTIADRFTYAFRRHIREGGLSNNEARRLLGDCCRILDAEQREDAS